LDVYGPFDLIPAPSAGLQDEVAEWKGAWRDDYEISSDLLASAENVDLLKQAKRNGGKKWDKSAASGQVALDDDDLLEMGSDDSKRERLTKTLAWLHSRGALEVSRYVIFCADIRRRRSCQL